MSEYTVKEIEALWERVGEQFKRFLEKYLDTARPIVTGRATSKYMQDSGATAPPYPPRESKAGHLRILSGRLARSLTNAAQSSIGGAREGFSRVDFDNKGATLQFGSNVEYAAVHEYGFHGSVNIPAHQRTITQAFGRSIAPKTVDVRSHSRVMNIPARPYAAPALEDSEPDLQKLLSRQFEHFLFTARP